MQKVNLSWLVFNKKRLIGKPIVEFGCCDPVERLHDVSFVKDVFITDFGTHLHTENNTGFVHPHEHDELEVLIEHDNIKIFNHILGIKHIILLKGNNEHIRM